MGKDRAQTVPWPTSRLMTAQQVACVLGCSDKQVYKLAAQRMLPSIRITSRIVRFDPGDIAQWIASKRADLDAP
jgi:excisionase family DNA binding protein